MTKWEIKIYNIPHYGMFGFYDQVKQAGDPGCIEDSNRSGVFMWIQPHQLSVAFFLSEETWPPQADRRNGI